VTPENEADSHANGHDESANKRKSRSERRWMNDPGRFRDGMKPFVRKRIPFCAQRIDTPALNSQPAAELAGEIQLEKDR
jgi:hypothetical protein